MSADEEKLYQIALTFLPGVGDVLAKNLVAYCGSPMAVFQQSQKSLEKIPGIGKGIAAKIKASEPLIRAEKELSFIQNNDVQLLYFLDKKYPKRLGHCTDGPLVLYYKGNGTLNPERALSIVGTRNATAQGKELTQQFVKEISEYAPTVFSGLAYGIDIAAHKACVDENVPTVGVLAHGLDRIYPSLHSKIADQMLALGGLLTEFPSGTNPDRENFPKRNRIIAGLADATVVVEAAEKGGALITAELAAGYNRDVFAFPGRVQDVFSAGCNKLIYLNKASLIRHAKDLEFYLNWTTDESQQSRSNQQHMLFVDILPEEEPLANLLQTQGKMHIETLCQQADLPISKVVSLLFNLEIKGAVRTHPGKVYEWMAQV